MKTPTYRRLIYSSFIVIFLITAPLIVLYTQGFRYNFSRGRIQKTGIIRVTSVPRGADIYLNGSPYLKSKTPAKIERVLPGDYEIKISKEGYYDWQKKLAVYENSSTFAERIILWKKSEVEKLTTLTSTNWLIAPDKNSIALSDASGNIKLLNINSGIIGETSGGQLTNILQLKNKSNLKLISYSPSGRYLLASVQENEKPVYLIIDALKQESQTIQLRNILSIKFDTISDSLYASNQDGLWKIDYNINQSELLIKGFQANDFFIAGKNIYLIKEAILIKGSLNNDSYQETKNINCPNCLIQDIKNNKAVLLNPNDNKTIIVDLGGRLNNIEINANKVEWLKEDSLIVFDNFEIYLFELKKLEPEIITRLGSEISSVIWHPRGRHLFFSTENKIKIIEMDNREFRNITEIIEQPTTFLALDRAGKNLYFSNSEGIFKLNIQ